MTDQARLEMAREWIDHCMHAISSAPEADSKHLAALILRERAAAVEAATPGIERRAKIATLIAAIETLRGREYYSPSDQTIACGALRNELARLAKEEKDATN